MGARLDLYPFFFLLRVVLLPLNGFMAGPSPLGLGWEAMVMMGAFLFDFFFLFLCFCSPAFYFHRFLLLSLSSNA